MNVKELQGLIETLKKRMQVRSGWSEQEVRRELIDPLLQAMGWNTDDGTQVKREYQLGPGRAGYALFKDASGKPSVVVEAKRLSISRRELDNAAKQGIEYCIKDGIEYFAVTDGQIWEVYETYKAVPLRDKLIRSFNLASPSREAAMDCARAWELWRIDVDQGNRTDSDEENVVQPEPQPPLPPPPDHPVFVHGKRVDAAGYILTKGGRRDKRYSSDPCPPGTKWVVDGHSLDAAGYVLDSNGERDKQYDLPYPPNTRYIVDRRPLDKDRCVLTFDGNRDLNFVHPCPPNARYIEDVDGGIFRAADRRKLIRDGERNEWFKEPSPLGEKWSEGAKRDNSMGRRRRGGP